MPQIELRSVHGVRERVCLRATAKLLCSHDHVVWSVVFTTSFTPRGVDTRRPSETNMAMAVTADEALDAVCHTRIQRHSAVWSAVIDTDRTSCIRTARRSRSKETMTADRSPRCVSTPRHGGATAHTSGHCANRASRARVAESCRCLYGVTSPSCRKHLGAWQAVAGASTASAVCGLTLRDRAVCCAATWWRVHTSQKKGRDRVLSGVAVR